MSECMRCGAPIGIRAERHRVRLSRSWFDTAYEMWGGHVRSRCVERSEAVLSGTLCAECAGVIEKVLRGAMEGGA